MPSKTTNNCPKGIFGVEELTDLMLIYWYISQKKKCNYCCSNIWALLKRPFKNCLVPSSAEYVYFTFYPFEDQIKSKH